MDLVLVWYLRSFKLHAVKREWNDNNYGSCPGSERVGDRKTKRRDEKRRKHTHVHLHININPMNDVM